MILFPGLGVHSNWGKLSSLAGKEKERRQLIFLSLVLRNANIRDRSRQLVATAYKRKSESDG